MDITPRHIEQIEALHRYGNFRRAAEKLCISQPALSRSILLLEEKLGITFFDRVKGKLELSPYGRIVLDRGEGILQEIRRLHRDIHMLRGGEKGILNIGCGPIPAESLAGEAVARFNTRYPHMTVRLTVDHAPHLTALLRNRAIDFFVAEAQPLLGADEFDILPMAQQQGYFCCRAGHPLEALASPGVADVLAYPLALMWVSERILTLFGALLGRHVAKSEDLGAGLIECDNLSILLRVVSGSDAVTITSREILRGNIHRDRLRLLPIHIPELTTGYAIVSLKALTSIPAITELKNHFLETARDRVRTE